MQPGLHKVDIRLNDVEKLKVLLYYLGGSVVYLMNLKFSKWLGGLLNETEVL